MAQVSKNARAASGAQRFECPCGGEVHMKSIFAGGKLKYFAECEKCSRRERRPSSFR